MYLPPLSLTQSPLCLFPQNQYKTKPMSTLSHLFDLPNQICYVQCGFCTTILLVSVPCSSLSMVVTVRCGHCTSLLSVNMTKASFVPLHLLASLTNDNNQTAKEEACPKEVDHAWKAHSLSNGTNSDNEDDDIAPVNINHVVNKPPEKRQRAPSAYNTFIKEEIKRLKAGNPSMAHKEAFSTAAKNWAHVPPTQYKDDGESCSQNDPRFMYDSDGAEVHVGRNGFQEQRLRGTQYGQEHSLSEQQIAIIRK